MRRLPLVLAVLLACVVVLALWRPWAGGGAGARGVRTIVLFTPDTLRRDRVGVYGRNAHTRGPLTPRMDALAGQGLRFDDARTPVPLTLPGHTTMLSGLPPAATGVRLNAYGRLPDVQTRGYPLLAERLQEAGWRTGAFVSAAPLLALHGLDQGFDRYDDEGLDDQPPSLAYSERAGEKTVDLALDWVREQGNDAPVFLWVHVFEPHAPYADELPPTTPLEIRYDADVARTDRIVGRLLDGLTAAGRGDAAILLAADHGEALEELGEQTHGYLLGDAVLRVPFLLRAPGVAPAVRTDPVDLADVAPTLAGLAGLTWPVPTGDLPGAGRDLLAAPAPMHRVRVAETLFGKQRYGWAQLVGAVGSGGSMLVDAGGERILWLAPGPFLEPQAGPVPATGRPGAATLADALRTYRAGERKDLLRGGGVAGGYGSGARVAPFLDPQENGRLRSPYDAIPQVAAIDRLAQALLAGARPQAVVRQLRKMEEVDPTNPELAWWRGRAWERHARTAPDATAEAAEAYLESWRRGRKDANTLGRLVGVDARGKEEAKLALLRRLAAEIPPDARIALLEAMLLRALDRDAEADAACERAAQLCRRPWEHAAVERARSTGTCR